MTLLSTRANSDDFLSDLSSEDNAGVFTHPMPPSISTQEVPPRLTIIIPTRNEIEGVSELLTTLSMVLDVPAEVLFVDDSDDATSYKVRRLVESGSFGGLSVRLVHRPIGRRAGGLGGSVLEGMRRARGTWVCVLDADLQHPPHLINKMFAAALDPGTDLVIATRYGDDAVVEGLSPARRLVSRSCALAARLTFPRRIRSTSDPLSGFFMVRKDLVDLESLRPSGFKILLEIIVRNPHLRIAEVGYEFQERYAGVSKASASEAVKYVKQLANLRTHRLQSRIKPPVKWYHYDIHGIVTIQSTHRLPELDKFRCRSLIGEPTILVRTGDLTHGGDEALVELNDVKPRIRYCEHFGRSGFITEVEIGETTEVIVSPFVARSPHVLYTNVVEPILRWKLVELGYALVHAACFADGDRAYFVTARTDTGKTTTMLKVLDASNYSFLSDDLIIVDRSGRVLTYPKPLTISAHTVHALRSAELDRFERVTLPVQSRVHSRAGRRFAFLLTSQHLPVASINAVVQRIVPPPKYHVERLVPGLRVGDSATLAGMFIIERSKDQDTTFAVSADEALEILLANCDDAYGFPPYATLERLLHGVSKIDLRLTEREIIAAALAGRQTFVARSTHLGWADDIHQLIIDDLVLVDAAPNHRLGEGQSVAASVNGHLASANGRC